jgi:FixJ family two-component response regulator
MTGSPRIAPAHEDAMFRAVFDAILDPIVVIDRTGLIRSANKAIADDLAISPPTVEIHRARVMEKMGARSLSELIRMSLAAGLQPRG